MRAWEIKEFCLNMEEIFIIRKWNVRQKINHTMALSMVWFTHSSA